MLTALICIALIFGIVQAVKRPKTSQKKPPLPNTQSAQPNRKSPPAKRLPPLDPLDAEIRARVEAREQAEQARVQVQEQEAWGTSVTSPSTAPGVPERLPLKTKQWFFSQSERAFYGVLVETLPSERYQVFPNVRLNDLFYITLPQHQRQGTYARLRDKHVDFLIVSLPEFRPVAAIELDGVSHDNEKQQYRDAVKDVAFQSAGLPLVRLRAEHTYTPSHLRAALAPYLPLGALQA